MIAVYIEDFRDGRAFVEAAAGCGKPVVAADRRARAMRARAPRARTPARW